MQIFFAFIKKNMSYLDETEEVICGNMNQKRECPFRELEIKVVG